MRRGGHKAKKLEKKIGFPGGDVYFEGASHSPLEPMRNRAFTLIELLVVIGIIAILASIALPVYKGVQERARGVQDSSNIRQIGIGLVSYLNDHDDTMLTSGTTWATVLGPNGSANSYVSDWHVFQSPFDNRPFVNSATTANLSYGINSNILTPAGGKALSTSSYTHASSLLVMGPVSIANGQGISFGTHNVSEKLAITPGDPAIVGVMGSHKLMNVLYGDSHVATIKVTEFQDLSVPNGAERWDPLTTQ